MSDEERVLFVDGVEVRFEPEADRLHVVVDGACIGTLELVDNGTGFVVRRAGGDALTKASPWGGRVTARFGTKELGARALLDEIGGKDARAPVT